MYPGVAALALACRQEPNEAAEVREAADTSSRAQSIMTAVSDSVGLQLLVAGPVRAGAAVRFSMLVQNLTARPLDLYLRGRESTFDVVVARPASEVVWRRLEGEITPAIVHIRTLAPTERFELVAEWDQRTKQGTSVPPGEYTARGLLLVEGEPLATLTQTFRIAER